MTVIRPKQVSYDAFVLLRPMWMVFDPLTKKVLRVSYFPAGSAFRAVSPKSARRHFRLDSDEVSSPVYEFPGKIVSVSKSIVTIHDSTSVAIEKRTRIV